MAVHSVHYVQRVYKGLGRGGRYKGKPSTKLSPVGYHVLKWMREAGLDEKALAASAGMSDEAFDRFMHGKQAVTAEELAAMARAVGATVDIMTSYTPWEARKQLGFHADREGRSRVSKDNGSQLTAEGHAANAPTASPAKPYNPDEAARLLAERFGGRVKRDKRTR